MRFVMTEHIIKDDVVEALAGTETTAQESATYKIRLGFEDLLPVVILLLLLIGYFRQELTFKEVLAYLGLSSGGGLWGLISGKVKAS